MIITHYQTKPKLGHPTIPKLLHHKFSACEEVNKQRKEYMVLVEKIKHGKSNQQDKHRAFFLRPMRRSYEIGSCYAYNLGN